MFGGKEPRCTEDLTVLITEVTIILENPSGKADVNKYGRRGCVHLKNHF